MAMDARLWQPKRRPPRLWSAWAERFPSALSVFPSSESDSPSAARSPHTTAPQPRPRPARGGCGSSGRGGQAGPGPRCAPAPPRLPRARAASSGPSSGPAPPAGPSGSAASPRPRRAHGRRRAELREPARGRGGCRGSGGRCGRREALPSSSGCPRAGKARPGGGRQRVRPAWASWLRAAARIPCPHLLPAFPCGAAWLRAVTAAPGLVGHCSVHGIRGKMWCFPGVLLQGGTLRGDLGLGSVLRRAVWAGGGHCPSACCCFPFGFRHFASLCLAAADANLCLMPLLH